MRFIERNNSIFNFQTEQTIYIIQIHQFFDCYNNKIMEQQQGIIPMRMSKANQIQILVKAYEESKKRIEELKEEKIHWLNIFINNQMVTILPCQQTLNGFVKDLLKQMFPQKMVINSYGFITNPKQNNSYQEYHIDYARDVFTFFIPLVPMNTGNSMQFIKQNIKIDGMYGDEANKQWHFYGYDDIKILQAQNIFYFEVSKIVCRAFTILKMMNGCIHRGAPNTTGTDRPVFWISCSETEGHLDY